MSTGYRRLATDAEIHEYLAKVGVKDPVVKSYYRAFAVLGGEKRQALRRLEDAERRHDHVDILRFTPAVDSIDYEIRFLENEFDVYLRGIHLEIWEHYLATRFYCGAGTGTGHTVDTFAITYKDDDEDISEALLTACFKQAKKWCPAPYYDPDEEVKGPKQPRDFGYAVARMSTLDLPDKYPKYPRIDTGDL